MTSDPIAEQILAEITAMLVETVGDEFLLAEEVTLDTTFNEDLALESIEFVALAELLQQRYGSAVDLIAFLAEKDMEEILAMTVGDLVSHIAGRPAPAGAGDPSPTVAGAPAPAPAG
ncbi:phosphopantetheine-binding protein [Streptomyces sp. NBC_00879]|uniref:acyl carrier protein n=1 Tax=unclassified Streptomyces TaxID=2593676 RepID=UPI00387031DA|nr:phosphopantetheine-binding protein [Streptomyces sp. NBC_00885]WSY73104.1 phosphopantetheine-binding protein [Streptomyces sp. NBC_00879]